MLVISIITLLVSVTAFLVFSAGSYQQD